METLQRQMKNSRRDARSRVSKIDREDHQKVGGSESKGVYISIQIDVLKQLMLHSNTKLCNIYILDATEGLQVTQSCVRLYDCYGCLLGKYKPFGKNKCLLA